MEKLGDKPECVERGERQLEGETRGLQVGGAAELGAVPGGPCVTREVLWSEEDSGEHACSASCGPAAVVSASPVFFTPHRSPPERQGQVCRVLKAPLADTGGTAGTSQVTG